VTKQERVAIQTAITEVHNGDYNKGIAALCRLVGWRHPAGEIKNVRRVAVEEIAARRDTEPHFGVTALPDEDW
jgi:hypothetical protein